MLLSFLNPLPLNWDLGSVHAIPAAAARKNSSNLTHVTLQWTPPNKLPLCFPRRQNPPWQWRQLEVVLLWWPRVAPQVLCGHQRCDISLTNMLSLFFLTSDQTQGSWSEILLNDFIFFPRLAVAGCKVVFPPEFWKELSDSSFEIPELWTASPGRPSTPHPCSCVPGNPGGYWHWRMI